jgi:hypothetical protein
MAISTVSPSALHDRARQRAIANRALIEQAKGVLILLYRIDAEHAFDLLRAWGAETNSPVLAVARSLIRTASGDGSTDIWNRSLRAHIESALATHQSPDTGDRQHPRLWSIP